MIATDFSALRDRCTVVNQDGNTFLQYWCKESDWKRQRAVVFLDPYGMNVEWDTITAIADTKAIDLWILFPHGTGVNRLLTKGGPPNPAWERRLTRLFGTAEWKNHFYQESSQSDMFGGSQLHKNANFEKIGGYFLDRLRTIFAGVAPQAKPLLNSKRNPMYLLCFAAGNKVGAKPAVKIASHLLKQKVDS